MKKGLFLLSFFFVLGVAAADAQSCHGSAGKSCCASKASAAATTDATIEKRVDDNGTVSFVRKESDAQGNVKFVSVQFDEATSTFVNVAPKSLDADSKAGLTKKACAAGAGSGKACCASGAKEGKACCAAKAEHVEQK